MDIYENLHQPSSVASLIDHTLLKPEASKSDIARLCSEARRFLFASVCVNPCWVRFAAAELAGSPVKVCTVVGFPLGANQTATKRKEAELALADGATELDLVQNAGALRSGDSRLVGDEIEEIAAIAHGRGALLKVIIETCLLSDEEKKRACQLAAQAKADFVKTSTGFSSGGALVSDVKLMREAVGNSLGVKASGGIRKLADLRAMVRAGANRIGASSGVQILKELNSESAGRANTAAQLGQSGRVNY